MKVFPVSSSMIRFIGYAPEDHKLLVGFSNHSWYAYSGVPKEVFADLMVASSHGKTFDALVKKGGYKYEKANVSLETQASPDGFGAYNAEIIEGVQAAKKAGP